MKAIRPFLLSISLLVQQCSAGATYVYPDGTDSKYDYPCDPNTDVSICCGGLVACQTSCVKLGPEIEGGDHAPKRTIPNAPTIVLVG